MEILNVVQGTDEWNDERGQAHGSASEAPAVMGADPNVKRSELLHMKATGEERQFSEWVRRNILDHGHAVEEAARPGAVEIVGEDLFRVTAKAEIEGMILLASPDGLTLLGDTAWEHKQWAAERAKAVSNGEVPEDHIWQLEHQLLVTGAERILFEVSDGTDKNREWVWYTSDPDRRQRLIRGWQQFLADLAEYDPADRPQEAVAAAQETLPTPAVQVQGEVAVSGNLHEFGEALTAYVKQVNLQPQDDQEFADLDAAAKKLKKAEEALTAAEEQALAQTASIQELRQTIHDYRETARQTRLAAEKAVKSEKESRRKQIQQSAVEALRSHYQQINEALEGWDLGVPADFGSDVAAAMKGKKTIASLQDAADTTLANAKIAANEHADRVRAVLQEIHALPEEYRHLFHDVEHLAGMDTEAAKATIKARVDDEKERVAAIQRRQEEELKAAAESKAAEDQRQAKAETTEADQQAAEKPVQQQPQSEPPKGPESAADDGRPVQATVLVAVPSGWTDDQARQEIERRLSDLAPSVAVRGR